jgi:hypothetical protein
MNDSIQKFLRSCVLAVILTGACGFSASAMACPNCKNANETDSNRPRAYMYSILFMIGMPATIFTTFGISFYRMTKKAELAAAQVMDAATADGETPSDADAS